MGDWSKRLQGRHLSVHGADKEMTFVSTAGRSNARPFGTKQSDASPYKVNGMSVPAVCSFRWPVEEMQSHFCSKSANARQELEGENSEVSAGRVELSAQI